MPAAPTYLNPLYLANEAARLDARIRNERIDANPHLYCQFCEGLLTRGWCFDCDEAGVVLECAA